MTFKTRNGERQATRGGCKRALAMATTRFKRVGSGASSPLSKKAWTFLGGVAILKVSSTHFPAKKTRTHLTCGLYEA
jgi:hypothetical protein